MGEDVRGLVDVHLVVASGAYEFYPINWMRNVALDNSDTTWVLVIDIDEDVVAAPGKGGMRACLAEVESAAANVAGNLDRSAFVLNSFQWKSRPDQVGGAVGGSTHLPQSVGELKTLIEQSQVCNKHPHWEQAYTTPSISPLEWVGTSRPQVLPVKEDFEPYLVVRREDAASFRFDTRFVGFRGNYVTNTN